ncbi:MAG: hypothetical protein LBF12_07155, partial [Christensenellaceae bacterium]|nr:hypothetical protein [Christensenellaceae bacterium]
MPGETLVCYSTNGSDYSESIPINAGEYYVKLSYTSAATDNYNTIVVTSDDAVITIEKASLSITSSKLASKLMKTYDAKYIRDLNDIIVA